MYMFVVYIIIVLISSLLMFQPIDDFINFSGRFSQVMFGSGVDLFVLFVVFLALLLTLSPLYKLLLHVKIRHQLHAPATHQHLYHFVYIGVGVLLALICGGVLYFTPLSTLLVLSTMWGVFVLTVVLCYFYHWSLIRFSQNITIFSSSKFYYLDTSAFVDGRFHTLVPFLSGRVRVLSTVIEELQTISDENNDMIKRNKGKRGLTRLAELRDMTNLEVIEVETHDKGVDLQLLDIVSESPKQNILVTTDHNLTQMAESKHLIVLNVNELNAQMKVDVDVGDEFEIVITKKGNKDNQGVGSMNDGTLVFVTDAGHQIGQTCRVKVNHISEKASGSLIFASKVSKGGDDNDNGHRK